MKRKIVFPIAAVLFALVAAAATPITGQIAWFKPIVGPAEQGVINNPDTSQPGVECTLSGTVQCYISTREAYNSEQGANTGNSADLLKYN